MLHKITYDINILPQEDPQETDKGGVATLHNALNTPELINQPHLMDILPQKDPREADKGGTAKLHIASKNPVPNSHP